jgi:enoyl-CoA hydratase/carnithine racemase
MTTLPGTDGVRPAELAAAGLLLDVAGPRATITLHRPEVRNAQTPRMWHALEAIGASLEQQPDVRVVVVRGSGPGFSAGLDRRLLDPSGPPPGEESVSELLTMDAAAMSERIDAYQRGFLFLRDPARISVAAVHGHVIGAGFQLALACDLRLASTDATFSMREAALGLVPDLTGTAPLVEAVGYSRALELCATARTIDASEAHRIGLLLDVADDAAGLETSLDTLVAGLTAPMPGVAREVKALLQDVGRRDLDDQRRREREAQARRFAELAALLAPAAGQGGAS